MSSTVPEIEREEGTTSSLSSRAIRVAVILAAGVCFAAFLVIFRATPPKAPSDKIAFPVVAVTADTTSERYFIEGFGVVSAKRELEVRPQVSGHIITLHPAFELGGRVAEGEVLFQIDPRDYEIAVAAEKANLETARFDFKLEQGNQVVAAREWKLLENDVTSTQLGKDLALRKPHLEQRKAALKAAESRLQKAELDLERTQVKAPFDILVVEESAELGRFVSPTTVVARVVSADEFYVTVQVPQAQLRSLSFLPDGTPAGQEYPVEVFQRFESGEYKARRGKLVRFVGEVDQRGRMARLILSVPNPLKSEDGAAPLLLGSYVRAEILGNAVSKVIELPRNAVREGGIVYVASPKNTLIRRKVEQVFGRGDSVYVRGALQAGERVITSSFRNALEGTALRVIELDGETVQQIEEEGNAKES